ncbi:MAG: ABC transporter ATP-binding protein [Candidatus Rokubacteria bacterium]|nr:ABC transporter ATP-binding protein [Candidatus Rokubacteria bacterium]
MLEVEELSVAYGAIQALRGVSLRVREGSIVTLIGANGAGKTTLLRTISGLLRPGAGRIRFTGREITGLEAEAIVRLGISHAPEGRQNFAALSVRDNLLIGAYPIYRRGGRAAVLEDLERVCTLFPVLRERQRQLAGTLSGGEQQMLAVGRVLMARPRLLLLDEPSMGLAPLVVQEILRQIRRLPEAGTTVLLVEQNARSALAIAHRGYVIETGRVVLEGSAAELRRDPRVQAAYLGRAARDARTT